MLHLLSTALYRAHSKHELFLLGFHYYVWNFLFLAAMYNIMWYSFEQHCSFLWNSMQWEILSDFCQFRRALFNHCKRCAMIDEKWKCFFSPAENGSKRYMPTRLPFMHTSSLNFVGKSSLMILFTISAWKRILRCSYVSQISLCKSIHGFCCSHLQHT